MKQEMHGVIQLTLFQPSKISQSWLNNPKTETRTCSWSDFNITEQEVCKLAKILRNTQLLKEQFLNQLPGEIWKKSC